MKVWLKSGRVVIDAQRRVLLCDTCPCVTRDETLFGGFSPSSFCTGPLGLDPLTPYLNLGRIYDSVTNETLSTGAATFGFESIRLYQVPNQPNTWSDPKIDHGYRWGFWSRSGGLPNETAQNDVGLGEVLAGIDCQEFTVLNQCHIGTNDANRFTNNITDPLFFGWQRAYSNWLGGASNAFIIDWSDNYSLNSSGPIGSVFNLACTWLDHSPNTIKMHISLSYLPSSPP